MLVATQNGDDRSLQNLRHRAGRCARQRRADAQLRRIPWRRAPLEAIGRMEASLHFETLEAAVRRIIMDALTLAGGNQRQAATLLGVSRWRLARMIRRLELGDFVTSMRTEAPRPDHEVPS
jgi:DNA-binding NtrC family response regulator